MRRKLRIHTHSLSSPCLSECPIPPLAFRARRFCVLDGICILFPSRPATRRDIWSLPLAGVSRELSSAVRSIPIDTTKFRVPRVGNRRLNISSRSFPVLQLRGRAHVFGLGFDVWWPFSSQAEFDGHPGLYTAHANMKSASACACAASLKGTWRGAEEVYRDYSMAYRGLWFGAACAAHGRGSRCLLPSSSLDTAMASRFFAEKIFCS